MPGKVNPVIPEAVAQAALSVFAHDQAIGFAAASGSLELNPFLPLVARLPADEPRPPRPRLPDPRGPLRRGPLRRRGALPEARRRLDGDRDGAPSRCSATTARSGSSTRPPCRAGASARRPSPKGSSPPAEFDALTSPEAVCRLGSPDAGAGPRAKGDR